MSGEEQEGTLIARQEHSGWYPSLTAWLLGVIFVGFVALLGGAISSSTDLVDISGKLITSVRMASIGLGTGYYIGSSLHHQEAEKSWFLFGVFTALSVLAIYTNNAVIFGRFPAYILLITGAVLSVVAHVTPLVVNNEDYLALLRYTAGYVTTSAVVVLAISDYLLTLIFYIWNWYQSLHIVDRGVVGLFLAAVGVGIYWMNHTINENRIEQKANSLAERELRSIVSADHETWHNMSREEQNKAFMNIVNQMEFDADSEETD